MKRALILIFLWTTLSFGETKYPFVGIVGYSSDMGGERGAIGGLRYGQQSRDWRTTFSAEMSYNDYQVFSIQVDRTLLYSLTTSKLRIYGGLIGAAITQERNDGSGDKNLGYGYGVTTGLMFYLSDKIDLDLGYRYMRVTDLDTIDEINSVSFAIHYFF